MLVVDWLFWLELRLCEAYVRLFLRRCLRCGYLVDRWGACAICRARRLGLI